MNVAYLGANDSKLLCLLLHGPAHSKPLVVKTGKVMSSADFGSFLTLARLGRAERAEVPIKPVIIPSGRVNYNFSSNE